MLSYFMCRSGSEVGGRLWGRKRNPCFALIGAEDRISALQLVVMQNFSELVAINPVRVQG